MPFLCNVCSLLHLVYLIFLLWKLFLNFSSLAQNYSYLWKILDLFFRIKFVACRTEPYVIGFQIRLLHNSSLHLKKFHVSPNIPVYTVFYKIYPTYYFHLRNGERYTTYAHTHTHKKNSNWCF